MEGGRGVAVERAGGPRHRDPRRAGRHQELEGVADLDAERVLADERHGTRRLREAGEVVPVAPAARETAKERPRDHLAVVEHDAAERHPRTVAQLDERRDPIDDPRDHEVGIHALHRRARHRFGVELTFATSVAPDEGGMSKRRSAYRMN